MTARANQVAFLTQHGKDNLLRAPFLSKTGLSLIRATGFDTDLLGTFSREVPRLGSQLDAARTKALKGIELTGLSLGLGSEGSFCMDPVGGLLPWNTEVLVLHDSETRREIVGIAQGIGGGAQVTVSSREELQKSAQQLGFPGHGLMLRAADSSDAVIFKGLQTPEALLKAFDTAQAKSPSGTVIAETDLRAHMNPTRQQMISRAADNLIAKYLSHCPQCQASGFWETNRVSGKPCAWCDAPTRLPVATIWTCPACSYTEHRPESATPLADPSQCDFCNP